MSRSRSVFRVVATICLPAVLLATAACNRGAPKAVPAPTLVRTEVVQPADHRSAITLTGDVQARFVAQLSFRVSGRVTERLVDVGAHVKAGEVLARIDPAEQRADLDATRAAVTAAESQVQVAAATFKRQQSLLANGYTTRAAYDRAQEALRTAEGSLEATKAQLGTAEDALTYTELRAGAPGIITARNIEVGQVAQAAQSVFTLAQDGDRDAVFDVQESAFFRQLDNDVIDLKLLSDPRVTAQGRPREISPTIDPRTGTVRVRIAIENPPAAMTLGSLVTGTARMKPQSRIVLPWSALTSLGRSPAVWIVDPADGKVSLRTVGIAAFETGAVVVASGLKPGERVVTDGGKLLSPGQSVSFEDRRS